MLPLNTAVDTHTRPLISGQRTPPLLTIQTHWGSIHLSFVDTSAFINKKPRTTNHNNFIYPYQVYILQATIHKPNIAFKENIFKGGAMNFRKITMFACYCTLCMCLLADTSVNQMAQCVATHVLHLVQILYSIALLAIVHMCQEYKTRYSLYTICLHWHPTY